MQSLLEFTTLTKLHVKIIENIVMQAKTRNAVVGELWIGIDIIVQQGMQSMEWWVRKREDEATDGDGVVTMKTHEKKPDGAICM